MEHLAAHLRAEGQDASTAALFTQHAQEAQQRGDVVRRLVMQRPARPPATAHEDAPGAQTTTRRRHGHSAGTRPSRAVPARGCEEAEGGHHGTET
jgi:hypothetical protein